MSSRFTGISSFLPFKRLGDLWHREDPIGGVTWRESATQRVVDPFPQRIVQRDLGREHDEEDKLGVLDVDLDDETVLDLRQALDDRVELRRSHANAARG